MFFVIAVGALITKKPSSVIAEEGENVTLLYKASGLPDTNDHMAKTIRPFAKRKDCSDRREHDYTQCN